MKRRWTQVVGERLEQNRRKKKKRTTNTPTTFQNRNGETVKKPRKQMRDQMKSVEIYGTNLLKFLFSLSSHFLLHFFLFRIQFCRFALARHFVPKMYHSKFAGEFGFFFLLCHAKLSYCLSHGSVSHHVSCAASNTTRWAPSDSVPVFNKFIIRYYLFLYCLVYSVFAMDLWPTFIKSSRNQQFTRSCEQCAWNERELGHRLHLHVSIGHVAFAFVSRFTFFAFRALTSANPLC